MDLSRNARDRIDDVDLYQDAPFVRALVAMRSELLWSQVSAHLDTRAEMGVQPDIRFVEAGIRLLRSLSTLYRLDAPAGHPEDQVGGADVSTRALVISQLDQLEARLRDQS